jgi:hypothetical protein
MNALPLLESFDKLKVGDRVTVIDTTLAIGYRVYEFLNFDPVDVRVGKVADIQYAYMLEAIGRMDVQRWHISQLRSTKVYVGYDHDFILQKVAEALHFRISTIK